MEGRTRGGWACGVVALGDDGGATAFFPLPAFPLGAGDMVEGIACLLTRGRSLRDEGGTGVESVDGMQGALAASAPVFSGAGNEVGAAD